MGFYNGLTPTTHEHLDACFSLPIATTKALIEKMVLNQGWNDKLSQHCG